MKSTYLKSLLLLIFIMCFFVEGNALFGQEPIILEIESVAKPATEQDITPIVDVLVLPDRDRNYSEPETQGSELNIVGNVKPNSVGAHEGVNIQGQINQHGDDLIDDDFYNEKKLELDVSLYPNPANNFVNIYLNVDTDYDIAIYDLAGNNIKQLRASDTSLFRIDLMDLITGMYFVQIVCNNTQQTLMMKVVK